VEVNQVDVGLNSSSVRGLRLYEEGSAGEAWAEVEDAEADVSLFELARGSATPRRLSVSGATVKLRFDKDGHLTTRLPSAKTKTGALPDIDLKSSQLTLRQEGRPDFVVTGVSAALRTENDRLVLTGAVSNSDWGDWTLQGSMPVNATYGSLTFKTKERISITQAMLEAVPLVPSFVWKAVQLEGDSPVEMTVRSQPSDAGFHYRLVF